MFKNKSELIDMLEFFEIDYELDSAESWHTNHEDGELIPYDELDKPSTYLQNIHSGNI